MKSTSTSACITPQTFSSSSPALILPASRKWNLTGTAEKHSGGLFLWPLSCYILISPSAPTHRTRVASAAAPRPPSGLWRYNQTFTEHHRSFWDSRIGCTATADCVVTGVKETLSNCADAGSRLQPTCFWFQRRSSNRYWLLFSAFITHNPSETATSSETQRKKATYILKPPDRRTVIHERHQSNAAFSITNMTSEQSFPEEAHEKHSSELLNTAVSSVHLTDKCCQNREKKKLKEDAEE